MIRLLAFLGFCVLTALIASWLSAQQGVTVINWLGWRVEMMTSLLVTGLLISFGGLILIVKLLVSVISWPSWLGYNWRARRRRRGDEALGQGMVAFAAGDMAEAWPDERNGCWGKVYCLIYSLRRQLMPPEMTGQRSVISNPYLHSLAQPILDIWA